jgi:hypothetical protein
MGGFGMVNPLIPAAEVEMPRPWREPAESDVGRLASDPEVRAEDMEER